MLPLADPQICSAACSIVCLFIINVHPQQSQADLGLEAVERYGDWAHITHEGR